MNIQKLTLIEIVVGLFLISRVVFPKSWVFGKNLFKWILQFFTFRVFYKYEPLEFCDWNANWENKYVYFKSANMKKDYYELPNQKYFLCCRDFKDGYIKLFLGKENVYDKDDFNLLSREETCKMFNQVTNF